MTIATWNVNSVRARIERLVAWLASARPDVVCLQELKAVDADFPFMEVEAAGYHAEVLGQKTYNGVAILARHSIEDVVRGLPGFDDTNARLISATVMGVRVVSAYVPNGQEVGTDKYEYKLAWIAALRKWLSDAHDPRDRLALCGDINIAPDIRDVYDPVGHEGTVFFNPEVRAAFAGLLEWGLTDAFRRHHAEGGHYSWWDYRNFAFPKNNGLRLDHVLLTRPLADCCSECSIDRSERKGEKPSDHAPVVAVIDRLA